jgi:hypothetical protein
MKTTKKQQSNAEVWTNHTCPSCGVELAADTLAMNWISYGGTAPNGRVFNSYAKQPVTCSCGQRSVATYWKD